MIISAGAAYEGVEAGRQLSPPEIRREMTLPPSNGQVAAPIERVKRSAAPAVTTRSVAPAMSEKAGVVVVANRLPARQVKRGDKTVWELSPGGLVSAMMPVLKRRCGHWIGWSGAAGEAPPPYEVQGIHATPIGLSRKEVKDFYEGFSNQTLWPLYHDAVRPADFRREWWEPYRKVNARFADAAVEAAGEDALIWVHDYQLQLVPRMIRSRRPKALIGFFLHIPFPPERLFAQLPWRKQLLEGMLGADVVGFHTEPDAENFARLAERFTGCRREGLDLFVHDRRVRARAFPISIDFQEREQLAGRPGVKSAALRLRRRLGNRKVLLGVDRLDYTKGIDQRLTAFHELLRRKLASPDEVVLVQVAVPSRERVKEYIQLRRHIEEKVGQINGEFSDIGQSAVHYLRRSFPAERLASFYLAGDVMVVTPLRDGMNLVCKEYVASRIDEDGALVLSEFAGAAEELTSAVLCNPHDVSGTAEAIATALRMPAAERKQRMQAMRQTVRDHDVHRWAQQFLNALQS